VAISILNTVKDTFGDGIAYLQEAYGKIIGYEQATDFLANYMFEHGLDGKMTCYWTPELTCRLVFRDL